MANNHIVTTAVGNLRGFSTDSSFTRPPNVADKAINIQKGPDDSLQLRRGYQAQIASIGGMGIGTFDDPVTDSVQNVCVGLDGFLYNKLTKQMYFYYNAEVSGDITNVSTPGADLTVIESVGHGLQTGTIIKLSGIGGAVELNETTTVDNPNRNPYTITVIDADNFSLDGVLFSTLSAYTTGGLWSILFTIQRYLTVSIFTDPRYIYATANQSITCNIIGNRAAIISGNQTLVNTMNVQFGHYLVATNIIQFRSSLGVAQQRTVVSVTPTSITFDGDPVTIRDGSYVNQFTEILFGKGFETVVDYLISDFITAITDPTTGIFGLKVVTNGDTNLPAAFLQIFEPKIVLSSLAYKMDYWYWKKINATINPPMPGSANAIYQNSDQFENASLSAFDDIIFIANGWDYPQKYDGQTVYRAGMPEGIRPSAIDDTTGFISKPFLANEIYQYAVTYEQIDNRGNIVEGVISEIWEHKIVAATTAMDVTVTNVISEISKNWNTNGAIATGGTATVYGPDVNNFYYDSVAVTNGYTLKIGDSAYYGDLTCAVISAVTPTATIVIPVTAGHGVEPGDRVYFIDSTNHEMNRLVASITGTSITIRGDPVTVNPTDATHSNILVYKTSKVFGNVGIVDLNQSNKNVINVVVGHSLQLNDVISFLDTSNNLQRRTVTVSNAADITISGPPVSVSDKLLLVSENQRIDSIILQRYPVALTILNSNGATLGASAPISNNLRVNIYRTKKNEAFDVNGKLYLVASIPNNSAGAGIQVYIDGLDDKQLGRPFDNPDNLPNPPPISKYLRAFGNQMFYAGGERGDPENSDRVFFSAGNNPEAVSLAADFFNVPNVDDDITGIGVSGSTFITTKNHSLWGVTGNFLSGQIEVTQIAPGTNIGCVSHASIASIGTLMYFLHTNGVYALTENQLFPTDAFGNPVAISLPIASIFRETKFLPYTKYVLKRSVAVNYTKDNQYLLFLPCENSQSTIRTANQNSILLCYDYDGKNWFQWDNMNAAGGMFVVDDELYFQERRFSAVNGNTCNLYKQHRFYRLIDHADHAGAQRCEWLSSWDDRGQPEVLKKYSHCVLLLDRLSNLQQFNNLSMEFSSYVNRLPNLQSTIADITQTNNVRNSAWSQSPWGWNSWSGYQDTFVTVDLKRGTVAKSMQVGIKINGINMDIKLSGFQLEVIPENRKTVLK